MWHGRTVDALHHERPVLGELQDSEHSGMHVILLGLSWSDQWRRLPTVQSHSLACRSKSEREDLLADGDRREPMGSSRDAGSAISS